MTLHHNPSSLAFNLNSNSLPRSLSPSPPRFSHGVGIFGAPASDQVSHCSSPCGKICSQDQLTQTIRHDDHVVPSPSLSLCASRGQIFLRDQISQTTIGYMGPTGCEGSASSFPQLPASLGIGNGNTSPPRGSSSAISFFEQAAVDPVHVAARTEVTRLSANILGITGYPGSGIPYASQTLPVNPGLPQQTINPGIKFHVTNPGKEFPTTNLVPIVPTRSTPIFSKSFRPIPAIRNTDKGKALALSPPQRFGDASNFFQAAQLDVVHVAAPRVGNTRPVGPAAGPSRSAIPCISGPVTKEGLGSLVSSPGPVGPINPVQAGDPSCAVMVNILSTLSKTQAEQEERARLVTERSYNLSRQFIQVKHGALLKIDNCSSSTAEAIVTLNAQAQAIEMKNDEANTEYDRVLEERNVKIRNFKSELLIMKEEREKEKVKETKQSKEKEKKLVKYSLMGIGALFSLGVGLGAVISLKR